MENFTLQNCTKRRLKSIAIEVAKIKQEQNLKRNKTNNFTDVVDTQEQQLSGFGVLLKTVTMNRRCHAITVEN